VRRPKLPAPVYPPLEEVPSAPEPAAEVEPVVAVESEVAAEVEPAAAVEPELEPSVFTSAEAEQPFTPTAVAPQPQVVRPGNSFHRSGNPIPVRIALTGDDDEAASGWVVERSLGGMTLMLDQEVSPETQVRVRNARPSCTRSSWITATVKQIYQEGNSFKLVCRFVVDWTCRAAERANDACGIASTAFILGCPPSSRRVLLALFSGRCHTSLT
jgi:hypothetical protein